jgi:DNA polymerase V
MRAMDRINAEYGRDTLTFAAIGRRRAWSLRRDFLSACYTTKWVDLLTV